MDRRPERQRRHGVLVSGGAHVLEEFLQRLQKRPWSAKAIEAVIWLLERLHGWAEKILVLLGRLLGRIIAPLPWSVRLAFLALVLTVLTGGVAFFGRERLLDWAEVSEKQMALLAEAGTVASFDLFIRLAQGVTVALALVLPLAFVRHRLSWRYLQAAAIAFFVVWFFLLYFVVGVPGFLYMADGKHFSKYHRNDLWVSGFWVWLALALPGALFLLCSLRSSVKARFCRTAAEVLPGDRIAQSILDNGPDPTHRTSTYWSVFVHVLVLFLIPLLLRGCGASQEAYGVPQGEGLQMIQVVQVKKPKKQKPKKRYFLNPNSPISFYRPDIDFSTIREELEQDTQDTYTATALQKSNLGKGGPGKGGWPHGMANARIRFIRLKYEGGDWDQDMGVGADHNLLVVFNKYTGFKIADNTEAIPVSALRRFPRHRAPPFVFITGAGNISLPADDLKTLRWYCQQEGGMLFADNGGGSFNTNFRALMKRVFPELDWVDIANDDVIYRQPFLFPNGAPPLWHHSGGRALGLKYNERWIVFYHQGDINDAWKTGHSGATEAQAAQAYKLGVNVMNYAFNQYMAAHFGD